MNPNDPRQILKYATLSDAAYGRGAVPLGWEVIHTSPPSETGFAAIAVRNNATGEIVIAFRGTDDWKDVTGNWGPLARQSGSLPQLKEAEAFYQQVRALYGDNITLTGHSLGGALAQLVAALAKSIHGVDVPALTYNAPGVEGIYRDELVSRDPQRSPLPASSFTNITNYNTALDPVSSRGEQLGQSVNYDPSPLEGLRSITGLITAATHPGLGLLALGDTLRDAHQIEQLLAAIARPKPTELIDGWRYDAKTNSWWRPPEGGEDSLPETADPETAARLSAARAAHLDYNAQLAETQRALAEYRAWQQATAALAERLGATTLYAEYDQDFNSSSGLGWIRDAEGNYLAQFEIKEGPEGRRTLTVYGGEDSHTTTVELPAADLQDTAAAWYARDNLEASATIQGFHALLAAFQAIRGGNELAAASSLASAALAFETAEAARTGTAASPATEALASGLGALGAAMNFYNALKADDALGAIVAGSSMVYQGAQFVSKVAEGALAQSAGNLASTLGPAVGVLGIAYSLSQGDALGAAVATISMAFPIVGLAFAAYSLLSAKAPPEIKGTAEVRWDEAGALTVAVTEDNKGGGASAQAWMSSLLEPLERWLAAQTDEAGAPRYAIVPQRLPRVSYYALEYPEMILSYLDQETGQLVSRHYDGEGRRVGLDGHVEATLAEDFLAKALAAGAIVPAWEAETIRLRIKAGDADAWRPEAAGAGLPQALEGGLRQAMSVLTLSLSAEAKATAEDTPPSRTVVRFDLDADGYLEATSDWVGANEALLVIDRDLDGLIDKGAELLSLDKAAYAGRARNSLAWLDANGDGILDASDPAFPALKLWLDVNRNAAAELGELASLAELGFVAIDFRDGEAVALLDAEGRRYRLTERRLEAETEGALIERSDGATTITLETGPHGGSVRVHYLRAGDTRVQSRHAANEGHSAREERESQTEAMVRAAAGGGGLFAGPGALLTGLAFGATAAAGEPPRASPSSFIPDVEVDLEQMIAAAREAVRLRAELAAAATTALAPSSSSSPQAQTPPVEGSGLTAASPSRRHGSGDATAASTEEDDTDRLASRRGQGEEASGETGSASSPIPTFSAPVVNGETIAAEEDVVLVIHPAALLANDRSPNAGAVLSVAAVFEATHGTVALLPTGEIVFYPEPDYYGPASFRYTVSDQWGTASVGEVRLELAPVNDAPVIEAIEYGRPIFGYQSVTVREYADDWQPGWQYDWRSDQYYRDVTRLEAVGDESTARTLAAAGGLLDASGQPFTPDTYRNGMLRPIAFDRFDATRVDWDANDNLIYERVDDPMREQGRIIAYDIDSDMSQFTFRLQSGPVHGHAAVNAYLPASTPENIKPQDAWQYAVSETGAWQYLSYPGDQYSGPDPFTVAVTDAEGGVATATVNPWHFGTSQNANKKPVTLDLDGDGLEFVGLDDSNVYFDVNGDGWREHISWVGEGDGLLVLDLDQDRLIDRPEEISFRHYQPGAATDLEGLRAFDTNGDGKLSALDERFGEFAVWVDANANGVSEPGEVVTLAQAGIVEISLASDGRIEEQAGGDVVLFGRARFTRTDGSQGEVGDAAFAYDPNDRQPPPSERSTALAKIAEEDAALARQAAVLLEAAAVMGATSTTETGEALSFLESALLAQELVSADTQTNPSGQDGVSC